MQRRPGTGQGHQSRAITRVQTSGIVLKAYPRRIKLTGFAGARKHQPIACSRLNRQLVIPNSKCLGINNHALEHRNLAIHGSLLWMLAAIRS